MNNLLAKTYKIDNHRSNCASIIRTTQDLLVMLCSENGEFVIFNRRNMETLATDTISEIGLMNVDFIEHHQQKELIMVEKVDPTLPKLYEYCSKYDGYCDCNKGQRVFYGKSEITIN